jgi:hypothetical protein
MSTNNKEGLNLSIVTNNIILLGRQYWIMVQTVTFEI